MNGTQRQAPRAVAGSGVAINATIEIIDGVGPVLLLCEGMKCGELVLFLFWAEWQGGSVPGNSVARFPMASLLPDPLLDLASKAMDQWVAMVRQMLTPRPAEASAPPS